jgi:hypothetical protein
MDIQVYLRYFNMVKVKKFNISTYLRVSKGQLAIIVEIDQNWSLVIAIFRSLGTRCTGNIHRPLSSNRYGNQFKVIEESSVNDLTWNGDGGGSSILLRRKVSYLTLARALNIFLPGSI